MALDDDIANLRRIPLFEDFEIEALRLLTFSAETKLLRAGDALFRRGEPSDGGFILTNGSIALEKHDDGRPAERVLRPFALIGETALITETTRPATAIAREPATILKITRALFLRILEEFPATATRVRARVAARLTHFAKELKFEP
ncbi:MULTISPECIES: cyclic nucleotide-binding domain-containing protein [Methylosinus]|uniref:Cyclic nucleotide-binding domain-containing protein n=1 Tax=Methylosinus sporium TaxID=428 RepID=A0A2U1SQD6_METSR|nr:MULTISPECIES: cyclic nucleotide-binding domain-containing protein [Methylosinus]MBU3888874.1 cyclic nucleotide-binding domain-containing protein [Methylosinus sp. KRF6]PWB93828.1 cyclic nucleotide-binding protein [Methylosinus sporium]TRL35002.1 cyclic nucleotide-binding domain-containing protein [Methylosinus sporium]